jgi:phosphoglycerol geranylgeranyltransferase
MKVSGNNGKTGFELQKSDQKIALLIDPDWAEQTDWLLDILARINNSAVDVILVGGSLVQHPGKIDTLIRALKQSCSLPVILFPGHPTQLSKEADGVLLLSVISGRNPELLIGQHVVSAPIIRDLGLQVIPTGYMIVGNDRTSVHYMSQTSPIPASKPSIAATTALAGEMLGLQMIYMDGGSGASRKIDGTLIQAVAQMTSIPLIIGGGIVKVSQITDAFEQGANMVVLGTVVEESPDFLSKIQSNTKAY